MGTRVTFASIGAENYAMEILAAAVRRAGHSPALVFDPGLFQDLDYFDVPRLGRLFDDRERLADRIALTRPDLVAFSVMTPSLSWSIDLARRVKARTPAPVLFGGAHPTVLPSQVLSIGPVDMVCVGEGEEALPELCDRLDQGQGAASIRNIWTRENGKVLSQPLRPLVQDLDSIPFPDKELFAGSIFLGRGRYMTMTGRGCPYDCSFCGNRIRRRLNRGGGEWMRRRSPENVLEELRMARAVYGVRSVAFVDDMFIFDLSWFETFLPRYEEDIGLRFDCTAHVAFMTREAARLMKRARCGLINFGVQTFDEELRGRVLLRRETNAQITEALRICEAEGLAYCVDILFGIPGEAPGHQEANALALCDFRPVRINAHALCHFPGLEITKHVVGKDEVWSEEWESKEKISPYQRGGSLNAEQYLKFRTYQKIYAALPVIPSGLMRWILRSGWYRVFRYIPHSVVYILDVIGAIKCGHTKGLDQIRYYARHLLHLNAARS